MALSAQNDNGQSGAEETNTIRQQGNSRENNEKVSSLTFFGIENLWVSSGFHATGNLGHSACIVLSFIPNPDAKPFVPTDLKTVDKREDSPKFSSNDPLMMCNFDKKHDSGIGLDNAMTAFDMVGGLNLGHGVSVPMSMMHSSPNTDDDAPLPLDVNLASVNKEGTNSKANKKHIAYHLLSNLLDDEIIEDAKNVAHEISNKNREQNDVFDGMCSWPASVSSLSSSFSLNLDLPDLPNQSNFSNRSIHEIWSPNPSPKGSYPSTPSDEIPYFPNNHDSRDSPYNNRSPVDILSSRQLGSPMLVSPCSLPSDSMMHHYPRRETSPFYAAKFSGIDIANNNTNGNGIHSNGIMNGHSYDSAMAHKQNMRAIRALQFVDPGIETDINGKDFEVADYVQTQAEENGKLDAKGKRHQVHFEDKPRNGIIIKQRSGQSIMSRDEMMTAAKRLGSGLDECLDQLRHLERECRKAEQELSRIYPSRRRSSTSTGNHHSRVPSSPTRVDKMIYEQLKVHDKIESLIGRIERLSRTPLHSNVGVALDRWLACIKELQNLRKDEITNSPVSNSTSYGCKSYDDKDLLALANCVKDLVVHTRAARTTVWCATQMLHAEEYWIIRPGDNSCGPERNSSDQLSEKS
eukprot:gene3271-3753_t